MKRNYRHSTKFLPRQACEDRKEHRSESGTNKRGYLVAAALEVFVIAAVPKLRRLVVITVLLVIVITILIRLLLVVVATLT